MKGTKTKVANEQQEKKAQSEFFVGGFVISDVVQHFLKIDSEQLVD